MRALELTLFAFLLTVPGLALAEDAAHGSVGHQAAEEVAHEVDAELAAHDGHDPHGDLTFSSLIRNKEFQGTVFNFLVLLALIAWVIVKKGNPALAARRAEVEKELAEAQQLRAEAQKRHMETASRLEKLDEEMLQIRGDMIKAGEAERDRIVEQAEEKAARMRKDTNSSSSSRSNSFARSSRSRPRPPRFSQRKACFKSEPPTRIKTSSPKRI